MCSVLLRENLRFLKRKHKPLCLHQLVLELDHFAHLLPSHPQVMALVKVSLYRSFATVNRESQISPTFMVSLERQQQTISSKNPLSSLPNLDAIGVVKKTLGSKLA